ncbi:MAG: class I SAM-dependent methyltransferase [Phycisphaerales bacterium]|nr:class I SAM-dependent methyltransferase [Phycisphaerales bacterium]
MHSVQQQSLPDVESPKHSKRSVNSKLVYKLKRFVRYIGLHKKVITLPDGVRYRERNGISIRRALSEHGPGVKEYDVRFPWITPERRRGMRIRYTASRIYGDVGHDPRTILYSQILDLITPGLRTLEIGCSTGSGSAILAHAVGPSGGVVAIDRDGEAIRFARQRHRSEHCGFELGWIDTLEGEPDGSFSVVLGVDLFRSLDARPERARVIFEVGRVVQDGGLLVLIAPSREALTPLSEGALGLGFTLLRELVRDPRSGWAGSIWKRPRSEKPRIVRDYEPPSSFQ